MITDEDLISKILSNDKGYSSHNKVIASYFASHQESAERADYMKSIVSKNHTWFKLDGNTAGYQASDSKMTLYMIPQSALDDDSNDNQTKELSLSWNEVAQKMSAILEKDIQEAVIQHEKDDAALKAAMAKPTNLVKAEMELLVQVQEIGVNADGAAYKKATGTFLSEEQVNALIEMDFDFKPEKTLEGYRLQQEKRQKVHAETVKEESEEILTEQEPEEIVSEMETSEAEKITGEATEETTVIDQPLVKEIVNEAPIEEPDEEKPSIEETSAEEPEEPKDTPEQKKSETKPSMEEYLEKHKATAESVEQVLTGVPEEPEHQEPVIEEPVKTELESAEQPEETQETEKAQEETIKEENHQESPTSVEVSAAPKLPQPESQPAPPQKAAPANDPYRYIVSSYENGTVGFKISDGNQFIEATRNSEKGQGYDYYMSTVPTDLKAFTFMLKKNLCAIAGKEPNTNNAIVTFNVNMLYQTSRSDMQAYADINNIPDSKIAQAQQQYELCKQTQSELVSMMRTLGIKDVKNGIVDLIEDKARAESERVRYTFAREDNGYLTCYDIDMNTIDKEKGTVITRLNDDGRDKTVEVSLIDIVNKGLLEAVLYTDAMNKEQAAQKNIEASYDNCPLLQTAISQSYSLVLGTADRKLITANPAKHIEPYICAIDLQRIPPELLNQMLETNVCALMERLDERLIRAVINPDAIKAIQPEQIDKYEKICKVSEAEHFEAKHKFDLYQNAYTEVQLALQGLPAINSVPVIAELIADRINALNAETRTPYRFRHVPESTRKGISLENKVIDYDIKPSKEPDRKIDVLVSDASQNTYGDNFRVPVLVSSIQKRGVVQAACEKRDKDLAREDNQETKG